MTTPPEHVAIEPSTLYFGTPVVLISTVNEDGTPNLAPMSSVFWLGRRAVLGLTAQSKTPQNILRTGQCVLNLPSDALAAAVDRLALTTGSDPVPSFKRERGFRFEPKKFQLAELTPVDSETVEPPRVAECPVAMEAVLETAHPLAEDDPDQRGKVVLIEVEIQRVFVHEAIRAAGTTNHIDPDAWRPLIMSFRRLYGLGVQIPTTKLAQIPG